MSLGWDQTVLRILAAASNAVLQHTGVAINSDIRPRLSQYAPAGILRSTWDSSLVPRVVTLTVVPRMASTYEISTSADECQQLKRRELG